MISHCVIPRTAALLLIAVLASCSRPPLKPRILNGPLPTTELINDAELIVVGTMTSLTFGKPIHMNIPNLSDCLIPVRVSVSVENVLRGSVTAKLSFEYLGPNCGTSGPVESPRLGTRSVFFLRKDAGRWRPLADYWMNRIPVYTGRHSNEFLLGKPIEQAISELLLTAGIGCSTKQLEEALALSMPISSALIGLPATDQLLKPYLNHPDLRVRAQACHDLNGSGASTEDCASRLIRENLDIVDKRGFEAVPPGVVLDLQQLVSYADPATRDRFTAVLPFFKDPAMDLRMPPPLLPPTLR